MKKVLVTGSSGFIGGHLVKNLQSKGYYVIGVDIENPRYEKPTLFYNYDLRIQNNCQKLFLDNNNISEVYNLACLMGGMGYIGSTDHSHEIMIGSTQIISNILDCCVKFGVKKYFYSSSACVYNMNKQDNIYSPALKESDMLPAFPDLMYGWQKVMGELMAQATKEQYGLDIRIARFHNIFGENGTWNGGKEKAPAALCRKISVAKNGDEIEVWGDGQQTRSFLYINELLEGIERLMNSDITEALNFGSDELISINDLAKMIIEISGKNLNIKNNLTKPQGVRGRNSDNTLVYDKLGWKPNKSLKEGITSLYHWIDKQING